VTAINAAAGRRITGFGRYNLSQSALNGPAFRLSVISGEPVCEVTYEWTISRDVASPSLQALARELDIRNGVSCTPNFAYLTAQV
jgi:hypothetical protein